MGSITRADGAILLSLRVGAFRGYAVRASLFVCLLAVLPLGGWTSPSLAAAPARAHEDAACDAAVAILQAKHDYAKRHGLDSRDGIGLVSYPAEQLGNDWPLQPPSTSLLEAVAGQTFPNGLKCKSYARYAVENALRVNSKGAQTADWGGEGLAVAVPVVAADGQEAVSFLFALPMVTLVHLRKSGEGWVIVQEKMLLVS